MNLFVLDSGFRSFPRCRCAVDPTSISRRWMSKTANPYPYPRHVNPTAHQIFHLPTSASAEQVKARYYELVRLYHPDKADATIASEDAHSRFQSIGQAYEVLQGKQPAPPLSPVEKAAQATTASRRAVHVRRHRALYEGGAVDDRWKDRFVVAGIVITVVLIGVQTTLTRRAAFREAMDRHENVYGTRRGRQVEEDSRLSSSPSEKNS